MHLKHTLQKKPQKPKVQCYGQWWQPGSGEAELYPLPSLRWWRTWRSPWQTVLLPMPRLRFNICLFPSRLAMVAHALVDKTNVEMGVAHVSIAEDYLEDRLKHPRGTLLHRTCLPAQGAGAAGWKRRAGEGVTAWRTG